MSRFHRPSPARPRHSGASRRALRPTSAVVSGHGPGQLGFRLLERVESPAPEGAGAGRRIIVEVTGDIDVLTAPALLTTLTRIVRSSPDVCCDLNGVGFFGAAGANVLALAHLRAAVAQGRFAVRGVRGVTAIVIEATGLDAILTMVG